MATVRLLHVSDTHLLSPHLEQPTPGPRERLVAVLAAVRAGGYRPDVVVHTGDIADDTGALAQVDDLLRQLCEHVVAIPGNHDDVDAVAGQFGDPAMTVGRWRILGLDTVIPGQTHGRVRPADGWLGDGSAPTVLLMHHPLRCHSTHEWFDLENREVLLDALAGQRHVKAVLSGHTHEPYDATEAWGLRHLGAPSTFYGIRHTGAVMHFDKVVTGARLVDLHDDGSVTSRLLPA